jgi:hypothetical protein
VHGLNNHPPPVLKHPRRNCVRVHRDSTGTPYRRTITSLAFKGESDPAGTTASWVIGAAAARAVEILERLQPVSVDTLFRTLAGNVDEVQPTGAQHVGRTNDLLNQFTTWINTYCHDRGRTDTVPAMPGGQRLQTRQFRRPSPGTSPAAPAARSPAPSNIAT